MKKNLNTGLFIGVVYVVLDQCNRVSSFLDKQIVIGKQEVREVSPLLNYYDYRRSVVVAHIVALLISRNAPIMFLGVCTWFGESRRVHRLYPCA